MLLRNPFYSVLALVVHLIALAMLFLLLEAQFVAAAQVVVYAGAVMVLYVFVVAYVGGSDQPLGTGGGAAARRSGRSSRSRSRSSCASRCSARRCTGSRRRARFCRSCSAPRDRSERLFLTTYLFPFEVASLLLMVAAVGAVVLARRRRGLEATEEEFDRRLREAPRPVYTGTMAETTGVRRADLRRLAGRASSQSPSLHGSASGPTEGGW